MRSIHALLAFCLLCAAATAGTAVAQGPVPASAIPPAIRVPTDAEKQRLDVAWRKIEFFDASAYPKNTLAAIAAIRPLLTETYGPEHPITLRLDTLQAGSLAPYRQARRG